MRWSGSNAANWAVITGIKRPLDRPKKLSDASRAVVRMANAVLFTRFCEVIPVYKHFKSIKERV
jgi:hypothetical protein